MKLGVRKTTERISLLMTIHLKRQWKALAAAALLSLLPFVLHPDQGDTLVPYEIQMYQNSLYRYGVWVIFALLALYCLLDMLYWQGRSKKIQRYHLLPVSPLELHLSWLLSFVIIFAVYFLLQGCLFLLFYQLVMARQPQLVVENGLFFSVLNASYTRAYLPMSSADACLWIFRILSLSTLTAFFGAGLNCLRRHWVLGILFAVFGICFIVGSFFDNSHFLYLCLKLAENFTFLTEGIHVFISIGNIQILLLLPTAAVLLLLELCHLYRLQQLQRRSRI